MKRRFHSSQVCERKSPVRRGQPVSLPNAGEPGGVSPRTLTCGGLVRRLTPSGSPDRLARAQQTPRFLPLPLPPVFGRFTNPVSPPPTTQAGTENTPFRPAARRWSYDTVPNNFPDSGGCDGQGRPGECDKLTENNSPTDQTGLPVPCVFRVFPWRIPHSAIEIGPQDWATDGHGRHTESERVPTDRTHSPSGIPGSDDGPDPYQI